MEPFRRMNTSLGSRKQQDDFVRLMEGELWSIVRSQDCEKGIKLLTETLKKFHVNNFAMQQQLMSAINKKTEVENWKTALVTKARKAQEPLVEQNMQIVTETKQVQQQFNDFAAGVKPGKTSVAAGSQNNNAVVKEIQQRIQGIWLKTERVNADMMRAFSLLLGK